VDVAFDTSAVIKLILDEEGSAKAATLWASGARRIGSALALPEAVGALAAASRDGRLRPAPHRDALRRLRSLWAETTVVHLDRTLAEQAAVLAARRALSGADAVHLAAALAVRTPGLVFATWDRRLAEAAQAEGLAVAPAVL
jgi:predicted nucleic acid-binding protein